MRTTARGEFALVTSRGRMIRMSALELPTLPPLGGAPALSGGAPLAVYVDLPAGEEPLTIVPLDPDGPGVALGTAQGIVKRVTTDYPGRPDWEAVSLRDGDRVVGAAALRDGEEDLVFVTSDAQLLRFPASVVRPQGRAAGGMAGIRLSPGASVAFFGAVDPGADNVVVTSAGSSDALPGTQPGSLKVTPYAEYPRQGPRHGRRSRAPVPARRGRPRARVGGRPAGPGVGSERRRARAARGHRQARRVRHDLPGGHRRGRRAGALTRRHRCPRTAGPPCYAIVTGWGRGIVALRV